MSFTKTKTNHKKKNNFIKFNIHSKNIYLVYGSLYFNFQFGIFMAIKIPLHIYIYIYKIESIDASCVIIITFQSINNNNKLP